MKALVSSRGLICRLGGRLVLDGAELEIAPGQSLALLGASGSGKSTLLRIIAGLEIPEEGEVHVAGAPATRGGRLLVAPCRRGLAMLKRNNLLTSDVERRGARTVLTAASLTYVAALVQSVSTLLYYGSMLTGSSRRRR